MDKRIRRMFKGRQMRHHLKDDPVDRKLLATLLLLDKRIDRHDKNLAKLNKCARDMKRLAKRAKA
jgi:hypothetical protein